MQALYEARNLGQICVVAFLDLRKAFDTVDHLILLNELNDIGLSDMAVQWFKSYLTGRTQVTVANGKRSDTLDIRCGVPQGSVLGPLLFVIYINKLVSVLEHSKFYMYADDLAVMVSSSDVDIAARLLQYDMDSIAQWCTGHKLTINTEKTKVMWCFSDRAVPDLSQGGIVLGGDILEIVDEFSYLGVIIDKHLSFDIFCRKIKANSCVKLEYLRNIMKVADPDLGLCIYKHMILPTFDYGDFIVEGASKDPRKYLQTVQNHCLRACFGIRDPRSITGEELHTRGGCAMLTERRRAYWGLCTDSLGMSPIH